MEKEFCPYCMSPVAAEEPCPACGLTAGTYSPSPHHLPPGTVLRDRYLVGRALGEGGFGITYIGCDLRLELKVAIKEYFPTDKANRVTSASLSVSSYAGAAGSQYETGKARFLQEARTMARMDKQPVIVSVRDFFEVNNTAYIVMEYVEGTTLKELVSQRGGRIPAGELLHMIEPLFSALGAMHELGLIHRDISPENLMLEKGEIRLLDFGCARESSGGEATMTIALKHGYAPVEQYQNKGQGPWTDVYALSATIYYCLTGRKPPQSMDRLVEDELVLPRKLGVDLTEKQEKALLHGMGVRPRRRFQTVEELHTALYEGMDWEKAEQVRLAREEQERQERERQKRREREAREVREEQTAPEEQPVSEESPAQTEQSGSPKRSIPSLYIALGAAAAVLLIVGMALWRPWAGEGPAGPGTVQPWQDPDLFAGAAVLSEDSEERLLALLEDGQVSAITLSGASLSLTQPVQLTKPLRVEQGSRLEAERLSVGADGFLQVEGYVWSEGILRTTGGGSVHVASTGLLEGRAMAWCEREEDLTVEEGGSASFSGHDWGKSAAHSLVLSEEDMLSRAVHVSTQRQLLSALEDGERPVVIDADITVDLGEGFGQPCSVLIPEGVTVTLAEGSVWGVDSSRLINRGTIRGKVDVGVWNGGDTAWVINYGVMDAAMWVDAPGGLINYGEMSIHNSQFLPSTCVYNLGTLTCCGLADSPDFPGRLEASEFFMDIACEALYNYGTLRIQGDGPEDSGRAHIHLANGLSAYNGRGGVISVGEYARLENHAWIQNYGSVRTEDSTGEVFNYGFIDTSEPEAGLTVSGASPDSRNFGVVMLPAGGVPAEFTEGGGHIIPLCWDDYSQNFGGEGETVYVSTGAQLRQAMEDKNCRLIVLDGSITLESELTVTKGMLLRDGTGLTLASGDLTVSSREAFLLGRDRVELQGGCLRVEDGALAAVRRLTGCGGISVVGENSLLLLMERVELQPGAPVELDGGGRCVALGKLELQNSRIRLENGEMWPEGGLVLRGCQTEIGDGSTLIVMSAPFLMDGDSAVDNLGRMELNAWEWQQAELAGTVDNRGRFTLPGHTSLSGTLTNYEYLFIQDSGSAPLRVSGTLDNRGVITASERADAGIQLVDSGSAPGVPEEMLAQP